MIAFCRHRQDFQFLVDGAGDGGACMDSVVSFSSIWHDGGAAMDWFMVLVWSLLFAFVESGRMTVLLWQWGGDFTGIKLCSLVVVSGSIVVL